MTETRSNPCGRIARVGAQSGRTYKVKRGGASIRNTSLWRLGTVEEGSTFHATHKLSRSKKWVWGHITQGPLDKGAKPLTYTVHSACGFVLLKNLTPVKRKFRPPPISFERWHTRVQKWIKYLFVNKGYTKEVRKGGTVIKPRKPRKNMPVFTGTTAGGDIVAYKNYPHQGERYIVPRADFKGVRYLTHDGIYMAWAKKVKWCFFPANRIDSPPLGDKAGRWEYPFDRSKPG